MGRRGPGLVVLALAAWVLGACATPQTAELTAAPGDLPVTAEVADVPFFPQEDYYCGPAALATVLVWTGLSVGPEDLASQVYTPERKGTLQADLLAAARRGGRLAVPVGSLRDLMTEVAAGHPVLVFQNLALDWYPQWHYAVAVAYDLDEGTLTLRSGREPERVTALETFERTWRRGDDWALVVLKPDTLPASAELGPVLRAASGLERADHAGAAAKAYAAILARWPESFTAMMGLGNVRYAEGDLDGAETAFRDAIARSPERAEPWNNLAYVLSAAGRRDEAQAAAEAAVRLSPDNPEPYLQTLREVSSI